jgi:hypothetical protein
LFRHCITPSPSSAGQPSSTKGTPAGASPAGVTTNLRGLSGRPARTSGRRPEGGQLADAFTLGPVTALTLTAALPSIGQPNRRAAAPTRARCVGGAAGCGLPVLALAVFTLAGLVLAGLAITGFVLAALAVVAGVAMPVVGSVRRLSALAVGGPIAIGSIPATSRLGCGGLAARRMRGQRRATCPPRGRDRRGSLGVLHGQGKNNPDEGPKQGAHHHQELAATAKRPLHRPSNIETCLPTLPDPQAAKPEHLIASQALTRTP